MATLDAVNGRVEKLSANVGELQSYIYDKLTTLIAELRNDNEKVQSVCNEAKEITVISFFSPSLLFKFMRNLKEI